MKKPRLPKEEFKDTALQHAVRMGYSMLLDYRKKESMPMVPDETVVAYLLADIQAYCERMKLDFVSLVKKAGEYAEADRG
jgi:hypothetical protein